MRAVDAALVAYCGMSSADLADWQYRDAYDDDERPYETARAVLLDNDYPFEDDDATD